jgi:two-component system OmpR family response regulator
MKQKESETPGDSFELLAVRIETLLHRHQVLLEADDNRDTLVVVGPLAIDLQRGAATWKGHFVDLSLPHYWMVLELASAPYKASSAKELMAAAGIQVAPNTIAAHIRSIRARFRAVDAQFNAIRTERGLGYRWSPGLGVSQGTQLARSM